MLSMMNSVISSLLDNLNGTLAIINPPPLIMHQARKNPNLLIERNFVDVVELPIFSKITNKEGVVFFNEEPNVEFIDIALGNRLDFILR